MALFLHSRRAADGAKYLLPVAVIISLCTFGDFFEITKEATSKAQEFYNSVNLFIPKWLNMLFYSVQCISCTCACGSIFIRDGFKIASPRCACTFLGAFAAVTPLNVFENFFDIDDFAADSFFRFYSFTVWHAAAVAVLIAFTVCAYFYMRKKSKEEKIYCLRVMAIALLVQYHSKDSVIMGDGYNVYYTVFACVPLFICNIGVYTASLTVFLNKRTLYDISFFVHGGGAISVFFYFAKDSMSNYGIFCSYSILYFIFTHCVLFALCVLPTALRLYKFSLKRCAVPLVYYLVIVVAACIASAWVTSYSIDAGLTGDDIMYPNYSFTQINPLPFDVPEIFTLKLWHYQINVLYVLGLYAFYVAIFFTFYGLYRLWLLLYNLATKKRVN
ncbi:MAG: YwaF family protein [Clostridia bacterium]|nr:YwaF family protein [Clostridia bacterium]